MSEIGLFPVQPTLIEDEDGNLCYQDGTPTLTSIVNILLAADTKTCKLNDIVVTGSMGTAKEDLKRGKPDKS